MTKQEIQQGENTKKRILAGRPRARRLLIAVLVLISILLFSAWYMRPIARVNRRLADFGYPPIPTSRTELNIQMGRLIYVRFSADPQTIAGYLKRTQHLPVPNRGVFTVIGDDRPPWFKPSTRLMFVGPKFLDDLLHRHKIFFVDDTVYILLPSRKGGLDSIINWLRSVF